MIIREAEIKDIELMQVIRNAVKENMLSDPSLVSDQDCADFITVRGKGWVCEDDNALLGFAIADLEEDNIWALFVHPEVEKKGIGRRLQNVMLNWYFGQGKQHAWLGTAPNTRAAQFYREAGWKETGMHGKELKF
ncbi:MAG: GNAT family N-acetyltransferase [Ferruginibacter sp.]